MSHGCRPFGPLLLLLALHMTTTAVTWGGSLYSWASISKGQLGTGKLQDTGVPKPVRMPAGKFVKQIPCGNEHYAAVTLNGFAYA